MIPAVSDGEYNWEKFKKPQFLSTHFGDDQKKGIISPDLIESIVFL